MKKIKTILPIALASATVSSCFVPTLTSCNKSDLFNKLKSMPRVSRVEKLPDSSQYEARYMVYFSHPLDWQDESKGVFLQRCEVDFRGYDRVNQLFTCGYELRDEVLNRQDYEISNHFMGNLFKPEYRFFDKSRPDWLSNEKVEGWEYLTNTQAVQDFHSMITAFKTVFSGKWAFSGTSKGGETTNAFAMAFPDDCAVYVPYVAPKFYDTQGTEAHKFQENVYNTIGDRAIGSALAEEYRKEIATFQYYALKYKHSKINGIEMFEYFWEPYKDLNFTTWAKEHHENVYDVCIQECATQFWQGDEDIAALKNFNAMTDGTDEKNKKCVELAQELNDPTSWEQDSLFFPYNYQAKTEMGEYDYDFIEMKKSLIHHGLVANDTEAETLLCQDEIDERGHFLWHICFNQTQYDAWIDKYDDSYAKAMEEWNKHCPVEVFRIYGGSDPWSGLRLDDMPSTNVRIYFGDDACSACNRSHRTRIKGLSVAQQKEIWPQLEALLQ